MSKLLILAIVTFIAACETTSAQSAHDKTAKTHPMRWEGGRCEFDSDCYSNWCVNEECTIRDP